MKVLGFNLLSENCILSAEIYSEVFQWDLISKGTSHAELRTQEGILVYFSPDSGKCRMGVGSFTLEGTPGENFLERSDFFQKEQDFPERGYSSFLDRYGNRIWFYNLKKN